MDHLRAAVDRIETARDRVSQDRREVRAELCALERFADRVEALDAGTAGTASPGGVTVLSRATPDAMADVREAYRSTVMDVDHYDEVYGEELRTNVAAELTPEIANAMAGTTATVPAGFTQAVLSAVAATADCRRSHLDLLDDEEASLTEALTALEEVLEGLADPTRSDRACLARLDAVAAARQPEIQRRTGRASGHELCSYLYGSEPWTYPVLSAVATMRQAADPDG
jgi:hypothetical protein